MKRIKVAPYGCILYIYTDREEWSKAYKKRTGREHSLCQTTGIESDHGDGFFTIGVFDNEIGTLVHELGHVCLDIAGRVGLGDIVAEQEAFCYLLGYLTEQSLKSLPEMKGTHHVSSCS